MKTCPSCNAQVNDKEDDNFNADHSMISCPNCRAWFAVGADVSIDSASASLTEGFLFKPY